MATTHGMRMRVGSLLGRGSRGAVAANGDLASAESEFRRRNAAFESTALLDHLRTWEYGRLDEGRHVYLDYTGGGLYAESQLRAHVDLLRSGVFGNPHSVNPTSAAMTKLVDRAEWKRRQGAIGPKISGMAFGRDRRLPITSKPAG